MGISCKVLSYKKEFIKSLSKKYRTNRNRQRIRSMSRNKTLLFISGCLLE